MSRVNLGFLSLEAVIIYQLQGDTTPMNTFRYTIPSLFQAGMFDDDYNKQQLKFLF